jgi:SAM-dependent methyltransferase
VDLVVSAGLCANENLIAHKEFRMISEPNYFSNEVASSYDKDVAKRFEPSVLGPTVKALSKLAQGGRCLEFAIGTGRVALPLQSEGVKVDGIELSPDMIRELRKKEGSESIEVRQGDMTTTEMGNTYSLVFLVFNTIMNLTSQDAQTNCFCNAAKHLKQGGKFVVEVIIPDLRLFPPNALAVPFDVSSDHFGFNTFAVSEQKLTSHHVYISPDGSANYNSLPFRYVWPSELDLMAQIAGMKIVTRHGDWIGTPFDDNSRQHVSVWEKA